MVGVDGYGVGTAWSYQNGPEQVKYTFTTSENIFATIKYIFVDFWGFSEIKWFRNENNHLTEIYSNRVEISGNPQVFVHSSYGKSLPPGKYKVTFHYTAGNIFKSTNFEVVGDYPVEETHDPDEGLILPDDEETTSIEDEPEQGSEPAEPESPGGSSVVCTPTGASGTKGTAGTS